MKAICLKYQGHCEAAHICLNEILAKYAIFILYFINKFFISESSMLEEKNLMAMTSLEMGLTKLNAKSYSESEYWLKKAQKFRTYFFKSIIHFRAHSALQKIKQLNHNAENGL